MSDQSAETPEIQAIPQQQIQVDPQRVIDSLLRQNSEQTRQIAHLEAFVNQQQEEKMQLHRQLQEYANSQPAEVEHNGRVTKATRPKKKVKSGA